MSSEPVSRISKPNFFSTGVDRSKTRQKLGSQILIFTVLESKPKKNHETSTENFCYQDRFSVFTHQGLHFSGKENGFVKSLVKKRKGGGSTNFQMSWASVVHWRDLTEERFLDCSLRSRQPNPLPPPRLAKNTQPAKGWFDATSLACRNASLNLFLFTNDTL